MLDLGLKRPWAGSDLQTRAADNEVAGPVNDTSTHAVQLYQGQQSQTVRPWVARHVPMHWWWGFRAVSARFHSGHQSPTHPHPTPPSYTRPLRVATTSSTREGNLSWVKEGNSSHSGQTAAVSCLTARQQQRPTVQSVTTCLRQHDCYSKALTI